MASLQRYHLSILFLLALDLLATRYHYNGQIITGTPFFNGVGRRIKFQAEGSEGGDYGNRMLLGVQVPFGAWPRYLTKAGGSFPVGFHRSRFCANTCVQVRDNESELERMTEHGISDPRGVLRYNYLPGAELSLCVPGDPVEMLNTFASP